MEKQSRIRVKSLAWIEDGGSLFVVKMIDQVKNDEYYRPVGGTMEFGELALETIKREVREELNAEI
jgi:ADP-ribose pyrophosphatase YjhB (NUDIX family)